MTRIHLSAAATICLRTLKSRGWAVLVLSLFFLAAGGLAMPAAAADSPAAEPSPYSPVSGPGWGGTLGESYAYHRYGVTSGEPLAPAAAPYRYGFAVDSHRWGWFGASRYYPRVLWHRGYHGDSVRWAYRQGF